MPAFHYRALLKRKKPDFSSGPLFVITGLALLLTNSRRSVVAEQALKYELSQDGHTLSLAIEATSSYYYILRQTENLREFHPVSVKLGMHSVSWNYSLPVGEESATFFSFEAVSIFQPIDSDGDGIDDRYELEHPQFLDPLDPADARRVDPLTGQSFYSVYLRGMFGSADSPPVIVGREATVFNFGQPTAHYEATSREWSVYNAEPDSGPPLEGYPVIVSRETTAFNFGSPLAQAEAIGRETTVFNFGSAPHKIEALGREVTIYNSKPSSGAPIGGFPVTVSRELTLFNFGQPTAATETISREVTVLNFQEP
jgi:hypothetical protein